MNTPKLTSRMLKEFAARLGAGGGGVEILGVANIERFAEAPERMHPKNIFPDCRSVISIVQPIPRSTYRGITEGTYWPNYTYYSYNRLNTLFRPMLTYEVARMIEDHGYEAVPVYPGVPETYPNHPEPVAPGRPAPDVQLNIRIAAMACGLGEIGWSKVFIHPVFGPRVRIGNILTDAELEPDPILEPGTLCKRCMKCVKDCPGCAIPDKGELPTVKIHIDGREYEWGDVHMGRCTATHHGINYKASPFLKRFLPGFNLDITKTHVRRNRLQNRLHACGRRLGARESRISGALRHPVLQADPRPHRILRGLRRQRVHPQLHGIPGEDEKHRAEQLPHAGLPR